LQRANIWQDVLHSPCALPRRAVNTKTLSRLSSSDFIWHLEKKPIFDTTGTKKHVSFPQSPLEAALSISTYPGTAVQKCPGSIMILFLLNPMIVGHLTIFVPQMILYIDIYIYIHIHIDSY
jgi:hypothetical protein